MVNLSHMSENGDWGMFHELGHNHQWMPSTLPGTTETGCNFASVCLMEELVGIQGHSAVDPEQRANRMHSYFNDGSNMSNWSVWTAPELLHPDQGGMGLEPYNGGIDSVLHSLPQRCRLPTTKSSTRGYYISLTQQATT